MIHDVMSKHTLIYRAHIAFVKYRIMTSRTVYIGRMPGLERAIDEAGDV